MLKNRFKEKVNLFSILSIVIGIVILLPLVNILFELFNPSTPIWEHIKEYLLVEYITNSIIMIVMVAAISILIGFSSAYFVSRYEFKGRRWLSWMLALPLAVPSYIAAYIYADMTSFTGTLSRMLRFFGINSQIDIMNIFGASLIFSFTLFPYIYLLTLSSLSKQSASYTESATLLGANRWKRLFSITLPLARPALIAGSLLVILETLNDYGVVQYFNVRVFSFAIFNAWFTLGDVMSAIRLSAYLMLIVFTVILVEKALRGRRQYSLHAKTKGIKRRKIKGLKHVGVVSFLWGILLFGFIIPVSQLIWYASLTYQNTLNNKLLFSSINTVINAIIAGIIILMMALMMSNFNRMQNKSKISRVWTRLSNLGYAIPGAVIAVAVHVFFVDLDRLLAPIYRITHPNGPVLVITLSIFTLIFSYVLRFLSIGFNSVESQYEKIGKKFTESAYVLGSSKLNALIRVDIPLILPGLVSAFILVFIDVIKELPLTLILRPANYDSLATIIYVYARDERIQDSSIPSLILITIAAILVYLFTHHRKGMLNDVY
jgi:iron(III) transport system permease protein